MSTTTLVTVKDMAERLGVHPNRVYELAKAGSIPAYKVGGQWRFDAPAVLAALAHPAGDAA